MKIVYRKKARKNEQLAKSLAAKTGIEPLIAEFLCDKGYTSQESIERFMNFSEANLRKVNDMKDGERFMQRLVEAVKKRQKIIIYSDYDGDGVCAASIFIWTFRWLGIKAEYFISNRFIEGYGLSVKGMQRLLDEHPDVQLVVTCDNGIVAFDGVDYAKSKGVDVIVSDHHNASPDGRLPKCPVVCEKRLDEDGSKIESFCGAELSRRICVELTKRLNRYDSLKGKMELLYAFSGFATITDVITLDASNHYVCKKGLEIINKFPREFPCFKALYEACELRNHIDEVTIGYHFGPMVNASGRITGEATTAVELFISKFDSDAKTRAEELIGLNTIRQDKSLEQQHLAKLEYERRGMENARFVILRGIDGAYFDEGIAGLIASYIVDNFKKPCICLAKTEIAGIYKGSGRSIEGFNLKATLDMCSDLLLGYGGHPMAAGVSVKKENIDLLMRRLNELSERVEEIVEYIDIDYLEKPTEFSFEMIDEYNKYLAPFGTGFEKPNFGTYGYFTNDIKVMKEKHIKTKLRNKNDNIDLLWFNCMTKFEMLAPTNKKVIVIGQPSINEFNGNVTTQFIADYIAVIG